MTPNLKKIISFVLLGVPLFVFFFVLYLWIYPAYDPVVIGTANVVTKRMSPPTYLEVRTSAKGGWRGHVFTHEGGFKKLRNWAPRTGHLIYLSIVTLPALLLATPMPFRKRLRLLAIAVPLMFTGHVVSVIGLSRATHCLQETPGLFSCLWTLRFFYSSGQFFAGIFWILLTWRFWFTEFLAPRGPQPDTDRG